MPRSSSFPWSASSGCSAAVSPFRPDLVECWIYRQRLGGDPEFLLIRRAPGRIFAGLWQCVTGGLEPGERVPMAALREVGEEIGFGPEEIEARAYHGLRAALVRDAAMLAAAASGGGACGHKH